MLNVCRFILRMYKCSLGVIVVMFNLLNVRTVCIHWLFINFMQVKGLHKFQDVHRFSFLHIVVDCS